MIAIDKKQNIFAVVCLNFNLFHEFAMSETLNEFSQFHILLIVT